MSEQPKPVNDRELLAWASSKLQEAQRSGIFGTVTFHLEGGKVVRSETNIKDKPGYGAPTSLTS
jgi:hypothetical protein